MVSSHFVHLLLYGKWAIYFYYEVEQISFKFHSEESSKSFQSEGLFDLKIINEVWNVIVYQLFPFRRRWHFSFSVTIPRKSSWYQNTLQYQPEQEFPLNRFKIPLPTYWLKPKASMITEISTKGKKTFFYSVLHLVPFHNGRALFEGWGGKIKTVLKIKVKK